MSHSLPLTIPDFASLPPVFYAATQPTPLQQPHWLAVNRPLATELGLPAHWQTEANLLALSGSLATYPHSPLATVYSGHQFGVYVPQLGDGRALLLGQSTSPDGRRWEWQLKGAGKTPFSRFADGRAVLRSSIREYLGCEALHGLGIATTRALALIGSPDPVYREQPETAAVLTRLAPSFIRFGHFEYFYHRGDHHAVRTLADFVIRHHYPHCADAAQPYLALFAAISHASAELVADWQSVGFTHGVLNSDNMSILGLTIDYGPFGFIDGFSHHHTPNHSDSHGRYAYRQQPYIVQWNLSCLGSALLPLAAEADLVAVLDQFVTHYETAWLTRMRAKLGLLQTRDGDRELIEALLDLMQQERIDFTLLFRHLADVLSDEPALPPMLASLWPYPPLFERWLARYRQRLRAEHSDDAARRTRMNRTNPLYVLRNHLLEQAIAAARDQGDITLIERLRQRMAQPFEHSDTDADLAALPPAWAADICLSCSS